MKGSAKFVGVYTSMFIFAALGALADEVYDLGRIEVYSQARSETNSTLEVLSARDINNSISNDVAQALRFTPGVFYQPAANQRGEPTLAIRGYSTTHIGLFIDGIPVHSVYDRQSDWSAFNTFGISEIHISKGYTSPIYGMNTLGGAVNVVTSKPKDKLELYAKYGFVSNNENQAALLVGSNLGKVYYQLSYSYINRDSLPLSSHFTPTAYQNKGDKINSYYKNHTLRAKLGFEPNENHEYSLNFIYQKGEKGGMTNANTGGNYWEWPHYDKITAYLLGRSNFTDSFSLESRVYYDGFYNELKALGRLQSLAQGGGIQNAGFRGISIYDDYVLGGIFTFGYDFSADSSLKFGLNLKNDNINHTDKPLPGATGTNDNATIKDFSTSIFAEYAQRLNSALRFVINGSYDRNDFISAKIDKDTSLKHLQGWTLQGIFYAQANDYLTLYGNVGKKSKLPTLKDRYSSTFGTRAPNPDISPESALNYELGLEFEYKLSKLSFALFYNDMNNMIISVSDLSNACANGANCVRLENAKEGYAYGGEIALKQGFLEDKITFNINYSYIEKKATNTAGSSYGVDGSRILDYPNHIVNASLILSPLKQLDLLAFTSYQSKQWYVLNNTYGQNRDIFLLDVKANYRPIESVEFSLGAYNLLDRNYFYSSGYYMAGRRVLASVEYRF